MINVRFGLFETNSSSVHSLIIMSKDQFSRWREAQYDIDNELLLKVSDGRAKPEDIVFEKRKDVLDKLGTADYTFQDDYKMYQFLNDYGCFEFNSYYIMKDFIDDYAILSLYKSE